MIQTRLTPQVVEYIPEQLEEGVLYVSYRYGTAAHKCCCGCGEEVITPLSPTDWTLRIVGDKVTLHPSVGNWSFACRSHYLIRNSQVVWAGQMTEEEINYVREHDRALKKVYFEESNLRKLRVVNSTSKKNVNYFWKALGGWWKSLKK